MYFLFLILPKKNILLNSSIIYHILQCHLLPHKGSMGARAENFLMEVLKKDPELPQMFTDIYWQLKNSRIQLFPLLCLGAGEDPGGRVAHVLMCSDSLLAKPTQSKVSDAGKVLFSSRAGSSPLWIKLLQSLLHKWNLRKPKWADSWKVDLVFRISY